MSSECGLEHSAGTGVGWEISFFNLCHDSSWLWSPVGLHQKGTFEFANQISLHWLCAWRPEGPTVPEKICLLLIDPKGLRGKGNFCQRTYYGRIWDLSILRFLLDWTNSVTIPKAMGLILTFQLCLVSCQNLVGNMRDHLHHLLAPSVGGVEGFFGALAIVMALL